jgi:dihydrofolate reductase
MAKLIYSAIASLDLYVEDEGGKFEWARPDDEVMELLNELERPVGTYLYGRRMYETLVYWETNDTGPGADDTGLEREWAEIWRNADKIVYSRTLKEVASGRTRIEREFEAEAVRRAKAEASADLTVGGARLAGQALAAGLVDELQLFLVPVIVGGGKPVLPAGVRGRLELIDERRLGRGDVFLRYRVRSD